MGIVKVVLCLTPHKLRDKHRSNTGFKHVYYIYCCKRLTKNKRRQLSTFVLWKIKRSCWPKLCEGPSWHCKLWIEIVWSYETKATLQGLFYIFPFLFTIKVYKPSQSVYLYLVILIWYIYFNSRITCKLLSPSFSLLITKTSSTDFDNILGQK